MDIRIVLKDWRYKEDETTKEGKICGSYCVRTGATDLANQNFNDGYSSVVIPFSAPLKAEIDGMTTKIQAEIQKHFTGKE